MAVVTIRKSSWLIFSYGQNKIQSILRSHALFASTFQLTLINRNQFDHQISTTNRFMMSLLINFDTPVHSIAKIQNNNFTKI